MGKVFLFFQRPGRKTRMFSSQPRTHRTGRSHGGGGILLIIPPSRHKLQQNKRLSVPSFTSPPPPLPPGTRFRSVLANHPVLGGWGLMNEVRYWTFRGAGTSPHDANPRKGPSVASSRGDFFSQSKKQQRFCLFVVIFNLPFRGGRVVLTEEATPGRTP